MIKVSTIWPLFKCSWLFIVRNIFLIFVSGCNRTPHGKLQINLYHRHPHAYDVICTLLFSEQIHVNVFLKMLWLYIIIIDQMNRKPIKYKTISKNLIFKKCWYNLLKPAKYWRIYKAYIFIYIQTSNTETTRSSICIILSQWEQNLTV